MAKNTIGVPDESDVIGYRITFLIERLLEVRKALKALTNEIKTRTDTNESIGFIVKLRENTMGLLPIDESRVFCSS
jgi:hypothetical protein